MKYKDRIKFNKQLEKIDSSLLNDFEKDCVKLKISGLSYKNIALRKGCSHEHIRATILSVMSKTKKEINNDSRDLDKILNNFDKLINIEF